MQRGLHQKRVGYVHSEVLLGRISRNNFTFFFYFYSKELFPLSPAAFRAVTPTAPSRDVATGAAPPPSLVPGAERPPPGPLTGNGLSVQSSLSGGRRRKGEAYWL